MSADYGKWVEAVKEHARHEYERGARDGLNVGYAYGYDNARYVRGCATYDEHQLWNRLISSQYFPDGFSVVIAYTEALRAVSKHCAFHPAGTNRPAEVYPISQVHEFIRGPEAVSVCDAAKRYDARAQQSKAPDATTPGADDDEG